MSRRFAYLSSLPELITGYLANWKRLLPRKLRPFSIETWMTLSAVITPITEKTPMATPIMVRMERSLFVRRALSAMRMISVEPMMEVRRQRAEGRGIPPQTSAFCPLPSAFHS